MRKTFNIANVSFAVEGHASLVEHFRNEYSLIENTEEMPQVTFRFVDHLGTSTAESITYIKNNKVSPNVAIVHDFPFDYSIEKKENTLDIQIQKKLADLYEKALWIPFSTQIIHPTFKTTDESIISTFLYRIWLWVIFLKLIEEQKALIHASSIEYEGKGFLFGSWGGVGKTTSLLKLLLTTDANFLSDDMSIIDTDGRLYLNPKPLHIYPYNWEGFPELKEIVYSSRDTIDRLSWNMWATARGKHRVCRRLAVQDLFGKKVRHKPIPFFSYHDKMFQT